MPSSPFSVQSKYKPEEKEVLLFPFFDGERPCFPKELVPEPVGEVIPPENEGKTHTVFAGVLSGNRVIARAARLDEKYIAAKESMKRVVASAITFARNEDAKRVVVFLDPDQTELIRAVQEGAALGGYTFDKYLEKKQEPIPVVAVIGAKAPSRLKRILDEDALVFEWANFARDILNEPPNVINPVSLAKIFQDKGKKAGLKITVWDEKRLQKEKCGGILAVGKGAKHPPRLVIGEYKPRKPKGHLVLVGKGITFDTGGYCLKPPQSQMGMKYDMSGAAVVFGAACAISQLKLPIHLTVITPLAENVVSGEAYLTTDIITMRSGKTVQVDNTDAEGRLILADALTLADEKNPDWIVDAATLTGACVVALGEDIAAVYGTKERLTGLLTDAGKEAGEVFWPLPLHMPYMEQLKATVADCKNIGGKWGGSITAALFLKQFVDDGRPWLHLDIAGPAVKEEPLGHLGKGAKAFGVRALAAFVKRLSGD